VILNKTKKTIISKKHYNLDTLLEKTLGLIGNNFHAVVFKTRFGIHTFFLKTSIDVVILNAETKVVDMKERLRPNNVFLWNPRYNLVLELPAGTIQNSKTSLGDLIEFR